MYNNYPVIYNYEALEYDRKSRSDDKSLTVEEVLERHAKILDDYANTYLGGPIPEENKYREVGSSETIDSRPEMLRLLKAIESPAIKAILVVDVQRLSRGDLEDAGRLIKLLRYTNTLVITPFKTYDLRNEFDRDAFERELKKGNEYLEYFKKIQRQGKIASIKEGNYVGGMIAPGIRLSMEALATNAAQLNKVSLACPKNVIGKNTIDCMKSGLILGEACMIDGLIERMEEEIGYETTVVATGGLAKMVVPLCKKKIQMDDDLLLKGLKIIYDKNVER